MCFKKKCVHVKVSEFLVSSLARVSSRSVKLLSPFGIRALCEQHQPAEAVPEAEPGQNKSPQLADEL